MPSLTHSSTQKPGTDDLHLIVDVSWDNVILDRMLPSCADGLSILQPISVHNRTTPVLILSALASPDERIRGLRSGADDCLIQTFADLG